MVFALAGDSTTTMFMKRLVFQHCSKRIGRAARPLERLENG
jgi:hypothetical protein